MNKFVKQSLMISSFAIGLLSLSGQAVAHIAPGGIVVGFDSDINGNPMNAAVQPAFGGLYNEENMIHTAIGFGSAPGSENSLLKFSSGSSHLHGTTINGSRTSRLEPDAGGGMFELGDKSSFSLLGLDIAQLELNLTGAGASTTMTIRGYTSADYSSSHDVTIGEAGGIPVDVLGGVFDTETGAGINGTHLHLDEVAEFGELYLVEYFFDASGRANNPGSTPAYGNFLVAFDNVEFGPVVVSSVPVPAAVYLFGTALLGLGGMRKKQTAV